MTTHNWIEVGLEDAGARWCPSCGTLEAAGYFSIGSTEAVIEEPPCAGWEWIEAPDTYILENGCCLFHSFRIRSRDLQESSSRDKSRFSLRVNRHYEILNHSIEDVLDCSLSLFKPLLSIPGLNVTWEPDTKLLVLVKRLSISEAIDWLVVNSEIAHLYSSNQFLRRELQIPDPTAQMQQALQKRSS